jgi:hypothetical protein
MKVSQHFGLLYSLLLIGQIVLCNYAALGPYIVLTMLPAMIMCLPTTLRTSACMFIAFATGFCVDWLSEGLLGLNAAAAVLLALVRNSIIKIFLGEDLITRGDRFSIRKNGFTKIMVAMFTANVLYLGAYVLLDGAGTRPAFFSLTRLGISTACCLVLSLIVTNILSPDDRK